MGDRDDGEDLELGLLVEKDVGELAGEKTIALQQEIVTDAIALDAILLEHEKVDLEIATLKLHEHVERIGELGEPAEHGAVDRFAL